MGEKKQTYSLPHEIFDGRTKLLSCQRERLKWMKETYDLSYKQLADRYGISKSDAYYICNPKAAERKKNKWLREHKKYYNSEKAVEAATNSRRKGKLLREQFNLK